MILETTMATLRIGRGLTSRAIYPLNLHSATGRSIASARTLLLTRLSSTHTDASSPSPSSSPSATSSTPQNQNNSSSLKLSPTTRKVLRVIGRTFGYDSMESTALKVSEYLYEECAKQFEKDKDFYIQVCQMPENYQTWFSVTLLHVWMLMVRLRAEGSGKSFTQELVNRFFDDAEKRIRAHGISSERIVTSYMKDLLQQFHGFVVAFDEGMCKDDPVLAAAIWRNMFASTTGEATHLAYMVHYVREQLKLLDDMESENVKMGRVGFGSPKLDL
ncbi:uncharacterized protein VTP21DRAFT_6508 [Calcarisporiella thermophila]|uniref:uncharacterized protein n=1 Tax=Calcarisporiella thermophila TaxID=911321 RepID=UPI00374205CD